MESVSSQGKIKVLIAEDHPGVRAGLRALLRRAPDMQVVGEASDGAQAVELAAREQPDVVLLDLNMPVLRGEAVMARILLGQPRIRILIVTAYDDPEYCRGLLAAGAAGYLVKDDVPGCLLSAIHCICQEGDVTWISPKMMHAQVRPTQRDHNTNASRSA